jgi:tripartite-type tricarboxylate transporter receptor subunit TctC
MLPVMLNRVRMISTSLALLFAALSTAAGAQAYPTRVIRMIVASSPGGGSDTVGRTLAQKLGSQLGGTIVVDNRAGAGGRIGAEVAAHSPADGYTLLLGTSSLMTVAPALYANLAYQMPKDFSPISLLGTASYVLVVHPSVPATSVKQLVALAKARPGGLTYASSGAGTNNHLAGELFATEAGIKMIHVPYRSSGLATLAVVSGESDLMFSNIVPAVAALRSKRLRPLGIASHKRSPLLPDVATIAESGLPGVVVEQFYALLAPAGTPPDIVRRLNAETAKAMQSEDIRKRLRADGSEVQVSTPEELTQRIVADIRKWEKVARQAGVKLTN